MQKNKLWEFAVESLENKIDVCLIVMVDATGSGPNRPGAKLIIDSSGTCIGTVGGGSAEAKLIETAKTMLSQQDDTLPQTITMDHSSTATNRSGMICSGSQTFLLIRIKQNDVPTIKSIADAEKKGVPRLLTIKTTGLTFTSGKVTGEKNWKLDDKSYCYQEPIGEYDTIYLIGGGHVALALTKVLATLDFRIIVLDNRENLITMQNNTIADKCKVVNYSNIQEYISTGNNSYVCIMTYGHKHDQEILGQLAEYPLAYLGMMGSEEKIRQIKTNLLASGLSSTTLDSVYTPIGLPIGSNTPEEIAISIAAQLISVRAMRNHAIDSKPITST